MKLLTALLFSILISTISFSQPVKDTGIVGKYYSYMFFGEKAKGKIGFVSDSTFKKIKAVEIEGDTLGILKEMFDKFYKKDTSFVPVYFVDVTDTVPATVLYKKLPTSDIVYTTKGFALIRGFKTMTNGKPAWVEKPNIVGALDPKKQPIKNIVTIL